MTDMGIMCKTFPFCSKVCHKNGSLGLNTDSKHNIPSSNDWNEQLKRIKSNFIGPVR